MTNGDSQIKALVLRFDYFERQQKRWNDTHLNRLFDGKEEGNFGCVVNGPPDFDLVEIEDDEFVFYPIEATVYAPEEAEEEVVGVIASVGKSNLDEPVVGDSGWFELHALRHPTGEIEFWKNGAKFRLGEWDSDSVLFKSDEQREALTFARDLLARRTERTPPKRG